MFTGRGRGGTKGSREDLLSERRLESGGLVPKTCSEEQQWWESTGPESEGLLAFLPPTGL